MTIEEIDNFENFISLINSNNSDNIDLAKVMISSEELFNSFSNILKRALEIHTEFLKKVTFIKLPKNCYYQERMKVIPENAKSYLRVDFNTFQAHFSKFAFQIFLQHKDKIKNEINSNTKKTI